MPQENKMLMLVYRGYKESLNVIIIIGHNQSYILESILFFTLKRQNHLIIFLIYLVVCSVYNK